MGKKKEARRRRRKDAVEMAALEFLALHVSPKLIAGLERLVESGLYGRCPEDAAQRLIEQGLEAAWGLEPQS